MGLPDHSFDHGPGCGQISAGAVQPVLLLPSDYYATRYQGPVLQQLEHPISADLSVNDCFRPVSRFFDRITRPEQLLTALPEAMRVLLDPADTGTVTLSLPQDVQAQAHDYPLAFFAERTWEVERRLPEPRRIDEVSQLLNRCLRGKVLSAAPSTLIRIADPYFINWSHWFRWIPTTPFALPTHGTLAPP